MSKKVYVCEEEVLGGDGKSLVKVCMELDRAREWMREAFVAFKEKNAEDKYLSENEEYRWFGGEVDGHHRWECFHMNEHIGWYVTEVEFEGDSKE